MRAEKLRAASALGDDDELAEYLQEYRRDLKITDDAEPCALAFDATAVSAIGVRLTKKRTESCFAFLLLPLDHRLPHLLIRSLLWHNGKMNDGIMQIRDDLCQILADNNFYCHFIATDGDSGMNELHNDTFALYQNSNGMIPDILQELTEGGGRPLTKWPIPDLLHMEKNARAKLATNAMALHGESERAFTAESIAANLQSERMKKVRPPTSGFLEGRPRIGHFHAGESSQALGVWQVASGNPTAAYWMSPFVALNCAVRNPKITISSRLELIQSAFTVFWDMINDYPATGAGAKIWEVGGDGLQTFWTHVVLKWGGQSVRRSVLGDRQMGPHPVGILPRAVSNRGACVRVPLWYDSQYPERGHQMDEGLAGAGHCRLDTSDPAGIWPCALHAPVQERGWMHSHPGERRDD
jgi:hypothetical protein